MTRSPVTASGSAGAQSETRQDERRRRLLRLWLIVGLAILVALGGFAVRRDGSYAASASAVVPAAHVAEATEFVAAAGSRPVATALLAALGQRDDVEPPDLEVAARLETGTPTRLIVQVTAPDPRLAADAADTALVTTLVHLGVIPAQAEEPGRGGNLPTARDQPTIREAVTPTAPVDSDGIGLLLLAAVPLCLLPGGLLLRPLLLRKPGPLLRASRRHVRTRVSRAADSPDPPNERAGLRADIEGLRAIAVGAVVLWHAGVGGLSGGFTGVDMFFVLSGLLMTRVLLGQDERTGRVRLGNFYARRARRLLPAALTALVGAALLTLLALPTNRWADIGRDIVASAFYAVNWRMAASSVDYLAADELPSPVQHFWSLAVEEQFYLVWPVLVLLVILLGRMVGASARAAVLALSVLVTVVSMIVSVLWTAVSGPQAYFVTPTRMWELALGSVVACTPAALARLRDRDALALAWAAVALIGFGLIWIDTGDPFPGWRAAIPTVGVAVLLWLGPRLGRRGPYAALALPPLQWVGKLSYSIYLWHWPFIVVAAAWTTGTGHVSPGVGLLAAVASLVPAWLSFRFVEDPVRKHVDRVPRAVRDRSSLYLGLSTTLAAALTGVIVAMVAWPATGAPVPWRWSVPEQVHAARGVLGAQVLGDDPTTSPEGRVLDDAPTARPPLANLADDSETADTADPCRSGLEDAIVVACPAGDPNGAVTIALVGDSHAKQWLPALDLLGKRHGWRVVAYSKSSCPPSLDFTLPRSGSTRGYWQCTDWNKALVPVLADLDPDLVITSWARYSVPAARLGRAAVAALDAYARDGARLLLVRDTPRPTTNMAECLNLHPTSQSTCAFTKAEGLDGIGTGQTEVITARPDLPVLDLTDYICPHKRCAPVIGNVFVYRDSNHVSDTYIQTLAPQLERRLLPILSP